MLLEYMKKFIINDTTYNSNILTHYNNYISTLVVRGALLKDRHYAFGGSETKGVTILKHILSLVDLKYLKSLPNDFERFTNYFDRVKRDWMEIYDNNATNNVYKKTFITKKLYTCMEYLLPCECEDPLSLYPMDKDWSSWMTAKPLRCIDHNSNEYTTNILNDQIAFKILTPNYAVFTLDPILLGFMYFKYVEYTEQSEDVILPIQQFIHRYVIDKLMDDLQDIWLRNEIYRLFTLESSNDITKDHLSDSLVDQTYSYVGLQYETAMKEVWKKIQDIRTRKTKPEEFLHSIQLTNNNLVNYIHNILQYTHIPFLRQYTWQRYLRDATWVDLILDTFLLDTSRQSTKNLLKYLVRKQPTIERSRFWDNIHDPLIKNDVKDRITYQLEKLEKYA